MASEFPLPRKNRLTVALIVRDAEELLPATLQSVRSIADEIVIVDTGSTDRTRAIAAESGARVLSLMWNDDFSAPRNLALAEAQGDWILWLDAGETVSADTAQEIHTFVREQANPARAYMLLVENPTDGTTISAEQAGRIRLVPNFQGLQFCGRVRERLHDSILAKQMQVELLSFRIVRSIQEQDPLVRGRKARRDLRLAELEIQQNGWTAAMLNTMGDAYTRLGDFTAAIESFRKALVASQRGSLDMLEAYYGILAACDADPKYRTEQFALCLAALEVYPLDTQLLCAMGSYLQMQGRVDLALRAYQSAAEHGQIEPQTWHLKDIGEVAIVCWCLCLQMLNQDEIARQVLETAVAQERNLPRLQRQLIELYVKHDLRKEALEQINHLPDAATQRESLRTTVRGACLAAKQNWAAALGYLQAAYAAGCRDPLCLRWLSLTLTSLGDWSAAQPVLLEWQQIEPRNPEIKKYLEQMDQHLPPILDTPQVSVPPLPNLSNLSNGPSDRQLRVDESSTGSLPSPNISAPSKSTIRNPFSRK